MRTGRIPVQLFNAVDLGCNSDSDTASNCCQLLDPRHLVIIRKVEKNSVCEEAKRVSVPAYRATRGKGDNGGTNRTIRAANKWRHRPGSATPGHADQKTVAC